ncbi:MAG TPA: hypothetical protein VGH56_00115 [Solirubrobacteraceae bacterium]|jgi:hypothetical protein
MSTDIPVSQTLRWAEPGATGTLRVETVFRVADELHGQAIAARMIDRVHEIANLPECECDVDVSVEWAGPDGSEDLSSVPVRGLPAER